MELYMDGRRFEDKFIARFLWTKTGIAIELPHCDVDAIFHDSGKSLSL